MRRACSLIAGFVMAFTLAGCSESPPESGPVPFKPTQSPAIEGLGNQMKETAKGGSMPKNTDAAAKPATDTKKPADTKPAPDTKTEEPKK